VGAATSPLVVGNPGPDRTFDLRGWSSTAFPASTLYPLSIGKGVPGARTVVVGGKVVGGQSKALTWREMKQDHDGAGTLIVGGYGGDWLIVDGARYDNMMDDLRPRGVARFAFRNIWSRNTRDDVIENDEVRGGLVHDSLFESAYMFLSEQNGTWDGKYGLELSHVLVRLEPLPYDTDMKGNPPASGALIDNKGHGQLFKHFTGSDTPLDVHDCVFYVSRVSVNGPSAMNFPQQATWRNNVLIWAGGGAYPGTLPASGVEERNLTKYSQAQLEAFWASAVAKWKVRHGVIDFDTVDPDRLIAPLPF
jgi:hypothetical protein